jgi:FdhD protein
MYTDNYKAVELSGDGSSETTYTIAVEATIELFVNKLTVASILATPEMIEELALGYVICEGIVKEPGEIKGYTIDGKTVHIEITPGDDFEIWRELRSSGCVGVKWDENETISVNSETLFSPSVIRKSLVYIETDIYKNTRGTHAACLVDTEGNCVVKAVDIGRHNAFDKVVGKAYLEGIDVSKHFLLSSGRQSAGMVLKAARAGIPLVATKTAPFNTGIEAAIRTGVCLVGFVSDEKLSVFANKERLCH